MLPRLVCYTAVQYSAVDKGISFMQPEEKTQLKNSSSWALYLKCGAIFLLFLLSIIVVACGTSSSSAETTINGPQPTVTIRFDNKLSPTPTLAGFYCGAWVTNTTPNLGTGVVVVNAKFTRNTNGNPEGVANATAQATVHWASGGASTATAQTTIDGLAIFNITVPADATVNRENLVSVQFSGAGTTCTVDNTRPAYFVLLPATVTPTPSPSPTQPGQNQNQNPGQPTPQAPGNGNGNGNGKH